MNTDKLRSSGDWESHLREDEKAIRREDNREIPVVLLAGLQRLASEAGLVWSDCTIQTPSDEMIQAIYHTRFSDGTQWVGTADCNARNTNGRFLNYPTAVAESRAEARCLRKALGIRMLSSEEIGLREGFGSIEASPTGKSDPQIIVAINKLCETRGVDAAAVLEEVIENKERASSIFELSQLTTAEAQRALAWLNEQEPKKKQQLSAKEQRDARKAELQAKTGLSMKVQYTSNDGRLSAEIEGENQKSIFGELAKFQEVFEHSTCGKCGCTSLRFVVRNVEDNDFYEIHCTNSKCRARLAFGQHKSKEGTLFPRRKDADGNWLPNGGWVKFNPQTGKEE